MKIAYTGWTWLLDEYNKWAAMSDKPKRDFEQSLKDLSDIGYDSFENFNVIVDAFEDCPEEFDALVKKYNIEFVNVYHYLSANFEFDMAFAERCVKFLKKHGANMMNLEPPRKKPGQIITKEDLQLVADRCNIMGKLCHENGIILSLHPHWGTYVEIEEEIDYIIECTNPDYVGLCLDTAHTTVCGMDPIYIFDKYFALNRVNYVHFKDIDPDITAYPEEPVRRFKALGQGTVDFKGVLKVINKHKYDGVICVELDFNRVNNYESAKCSREYIRRVLGL